MAENVYDHLTRHARHKPTAIALQQGERRFTFAELAERALRVAGAIRSGRLGRRIAVITDNRPEIFELLFGAAHAGGVLIPLNWRLRPVELAALVVDAEADTLIVEPAFGTAVEALPADRPPVFEFGPEYERLLAGSEPAADPPVAGGQRPLAQIYTSGTTGLPKGVQLSHRNLNAFVHAGRYVDVDDRSRCLMTMPLFHIGSIGLCLTALAQGMGGLLVPPKAEQLLDAIAHQGVTHTFLVPTVLAGMVELAEARGETYRQMRQIVYGASPMDVGMLRRALRVFGRCLKQGYGTTETGSITHLLAEDHDPDGPRAYLLRSAGIPRDGVEIRIVDPDTLTDRPTGEVGEVWVRSEQVTIGYWKRPDLTAEVLTEDGWLRTGDGGYLDADGYLFLTCRLKDMIISGAENIYPQEVEEVLLAHPTVREAAVIGVPDPKWGEAVLGVVVLRDPGSRPVREVADEILAHARANLPGFKKPRAVEIVPELPRNSSGKVLRTVLRERYAQPDGSGVSAGA